MAHYVAHPGEFLIVQFRDGRQEHLVGPAQLWFDPRMHGKVEKKDALQIASKEAVVVYTRETASGEVSRRVVDGPAAFVPEPGAILAVPGFVVGERTFHVSGRSMRGRWRSSRRA